jgi:hypothetical protein
MIWNFIWHAIVEDAVPADVTQVKSGDMVLETDGNIYYHV